MSQKFNLALIETSAKEDQNISKVFQQLAIDIVKNGVEPIKTQQKGKKLQKKKG